MKPENAASMPTPHEVVPPRRSGLVRLWYAAGHSWAGLRAGWQEPALRLEYIQALIGVPLAFWVGRNWIEVALLAGSLLALIVVELLNTAIERLCDRVGTEWHELAKLSKDMGSAAVLLTSLLVGGVWLAAVWHRFGS
jgi:diacylglycerol kinase (ATP)